MVHCSKLASGELTIQVYVMRVDNKMRFGELSPIFQIVSGVGPPVCKTAESVRINTPSDRTGKLAQLYAPVTIRVEECPQRRVAFAVFCPCDLFVIVLVVLRHPLCMQTGVL